jgi:hypothetical protein
MSVPDELPRIGALPPEPWQGSASRACRSSRTTVPSTCSNSTAWAPGRSPSFARRSPIKSCRYATTPKPFGADERNSLPVAPGLLAARRGEP